MKIEGKMSILKKEVENFLKPNQTYREENDNI